MSLRYWPAASASLLTIFTFGALVLLIGCASPGDPVPRQRPIVPNPVQDLVARQQGNQITLTFTLPSRSTENGPLAMPPAIEIYRAETDSTQPKQKLSPRLVYTIPSEMVSSYQQDGRVVYKETIDPDELNIPSGGTLLYEVRTREARNRASAESNRVQVLTRVPPMAVEDLQAQVVNNAVVLKWTATAQGNAEYRVYRAEVSPASSAAAGNDPSKADLVNPLRALARQTMPEFTDRSAEIGHTYMYIVRQASSVGGSELESADSRPAIIRPMPVTPPAAPQGLEAVAVPASSDSTGYISLSWDISTEPGIAGYAVYRSEQEDTRGTRLNDELLPTPTYRDSSVTPGRTYFYRITVLDEMSNESEASTPIEANLSALP